MVDEPHTQYGAILKDLLLRFLSSLLAHSPISFPISFDLATWDDILLFHMPRNQKKFFEERVSECISDCMVSSKSFPFVPFVMSIIFLTGHGLLKGGVVRN